MMLCDYVLFDNYLYWFFLAICYPSAHTCIYLLKKQQSNFRIWALPIIPNACCFSTAFWCCFCIHVYACLKLIYPLAKENVAKSETYKVVTPTLFDVVNSACENLSVL